MSPSVELISPIKISAFLSPSAESAEDASTKATLRPMRLARARAASTAYPVSSPSASCMACGASEVSRATVRVPGVTRASSDTAGVTVSYSIWSIVGVVNVDSGLNAHPLRPKTAMTAAVPAPNRARVHQAAPHHVHYPAFCVVYNPCVARNNGLFPPADLVFDPTLAHRGVCSGGRSHLHDWPARPRGGIAPKKVERTVRLTSRTRHDRAARTRSLTWIPLTASVLD